MSRLVIAAALAALVLASVPLTVATSADTLPPETRVDFEGPTVGDATGATWLGLTGSVSLHASDDGAEPGPSGVASTWYQVDGSAAIQYGGPFQLAAAATPHEVRYWSVDAAGNAEAPKTHHIGFDATPPAVAITSPSEDDFLFLSWLLMGNDDAWTVLPGRLDAPVPAPVRFAGSNPTLVGSPGAGAQIEVDASDANGIARVTFRVTTPEGETRYPCADDPEAPYTCYYSGLLLESGEHVIEARAYDRLGNSASATRTLTVWPGPGSAMPEPALP